MDEPSRRKESDKTLGSPTSSKYFLGDKQCFQGIPVLSRDYARRALKMNSTISLISVSCVLILLTGQVSIV